LSKQSAFESVFEKTFSGDLGHCQILIRIEKFSLAFLPEALPSLASHAWKEIYEIWHFLLAVS
jgi:hypothetical protein